MSVRNKIEFKAIVIGASAGGIHALLKIFTDLPATFHLPIIVVLHIPSGRESKLAHVFQHHLALPVQQAGDKEWIKPGTLYFADAGYHLSIEQNYSFSLSCEEPACFARPAIDILMQSAADAYGENLIGILLTGANNDGAVGLSHIKAAGGFTIVQDPLEAEVAIMPQAAIDLCKPTKVLTLEKIHLFIKELENIYVG